MRILFYIEPLVERENPEWKKGWITHFVRSISAALLHEGCEESNFGCIAPTALGGVARAVIPAGRIATINQSELIPRFGASALEVSIGWYRQTIGESGVEAMAQILRNRMGDFSPDICLTFSPAPFLKRAFPGCKVVYLEFGLVSRQPFPETVYFDPIGMYQSGCLARFGPAIKAYSPETKELNLLRQLRNDFCGVSTGNGNPVHDYIEGEVGKFSSVVLLALQFSNFYAYDSHAQFKDQYDLLIHTLEAVPPNVGVMVCEHPEHPVLTDKTIPYLKAHYPNFIWHRMFREVYSVSYYLMPYVQGVVTVSSSVGFQSLLFKKKLAIVGSSHLDFIADTHEVSKLIPEINSEWAPWKESTAAWLLSRFHLPFRPLCSSRNILGYLKGMQCGDFEELSQSVETAGIDADFLSKSYQELAQEKWVAPSVGHGNAFDEPLPFYSALYHATPDHPPDEQYCVRRFVSFEGQDEVTLSFPLPDRGTPPLWLRFDPTDKPMNLILTKMWISDKRENRVWEWNGSRTGLENAISGMSLVDLPGKLGICLLCHIADPQIRLPLGPEILSRFEPPITLWVVLKRSDPAFLETVFSGLQNRLLTKEKELLLAFAEHEQVMGEREQQINSLRNALLEGENRIADLQKNAEEISRQNNVKTHEIGELKRLLGSQETTLREILDSRSWKMTRPLRQIAHGARELKTKISHRLFAWGKWLYRHLPLNMRQKRQIKNFFFSWLGFLFRQSAVYQQWYANHQIHALSKKFEDTQESVAGLNACGNGGSPSEGRVADGRQEWADYWSLRNGIQELLALRRESQTLKSPPMLDLSGMDLSQVISRLHFPDPTDTPLVSVIVPAFNHLQLTVECLLSIAERTGNEVTYEVLVADDASTDETPSLLSRVNHVRVISHKTNLGFLRNCNEAAKSAHGRYLLFLNNDVQVTEGWLSGMVRIVKEDTQVGAVGPMIIFPNGQLQEAGARLQRDGSAEMIGLYSSPEEPRFGFRREVDYCSGACLLVEAHLFQKAGGFDERFVPAYCEDSDLCLRIRRMGKQIVYCPESRVIHHLSQTTHKARGKMDWVVRNSQQLLETWQADLDKRDDVKILAFYLPQFHPIPENDFWWGKGFTEWRNVAKARPNFPGHDQPRHPADLGYYDLRVPGVLEEQASLAQRYGIHGFCFYYYWFGGKRLLEFPLDTLLKTGSPTIPFCLCWANENWTRRWDGNDDEILMGQTYSDQDDLLVIRDLMRYFQSPSYLRIHGKPLLLVYRVTEFPDFRRTAELWRRVCREEGIGEIYLTLVESFELARNGIQPETLGCDSAVEFPPQGYLAHGMVNGPSPFPSFRGMIEDYRDLAMHFASRPYPGYKRFPCVVPGWDNTPRRQQDSFCFHHATPGAFQAWTEKAIEISKQQLYGEERLVFVNAWNEWAEGAYLEPDRRFGHTFLEAILNARDSVRLLRSDPDAITL